MAAETMTLIIKARNESAGVVAQVQAQMTRLSSAAGGAFTKMGAGIKGAFSGVGASVKTALGGIVAQLALIVSAGAALHLITDFLKGSIVEAAGAEAAQKKLATALGFTSEALKKQADEIQRLTKFDDDTVVAAQAKIAIFTKEEGQIAALTKASTDLAEAQGIGLAEAAGLVAKAMGGFDGALSRLGIKLPETASKAEKVKAIVEGITALFGGQAQAAAQTYEGRMVQLKNAYHKYQEEVGTAITQNKAVAELIKIVTELFNQQRDAISKTDGAVKDFGNTISDFVVGAVKTIQFLGNFVLGLKFIFVALGDTVNAIFSGLTIGFLETVNLISKALSLLIGAFTLLPGGVGKYFTWLQNSLLSIGASAKSSSVDFQQAFGTMFQASKNTLGQIERWDGAMGVFAERVDKAGHSTTNLGIAVHSTADMISLAQQQHMKLVNAQILAKTESDALAHAMDTGTTSIIKSTAALSPFAAMVDSANQELARLASLLGESGQSAEQFATNFEGELKSAFASISRIGIDKVKIPVELLPLMDLLKAQLALTEPLAVPVVAEFIGPPVPPEGIESEWSSSIAGALVQGLQSALTSAKSFGDAIGSIFKSGLSAVFDDVFKQLQDALTSLFANLGNLGKGLLTGLLLLGSVIFGQKSETQTSFTSPETNVVESAQATRGIVAGPSSVAIGEFQRGMFEALKPIHQVLVEIRDLIRVQNGAAAF